MSMPICSLDKFCKTIFITYQHEAAHRSLFHFSIHLSLHSQILFLFFVFVVCFFFWHQITVIDCGKPGPLYNGWIENLEAGTGLGASIIFRCHEGMTLQGNTSSVCQLDGTWRYPLPLCLG